MSNWTVATATPAAQAQAQLFSRKVWMEARVNSFWNALMGEGPNNVIDVQTDFLKGKGDVLNYSLLTDLANRGLAGSGLQSNLVYAATNSNRLEGREEAPNVYVDTVTMDQLRHAIITGGKLSEQRLAWEQREKMKNLLAYWWARIVDDIIFKKLSGTTFTDSASSPQTFGEAAVANTNNLYGGGKTASNQLTTGDTFDPIILRRAKEAAMVGIGTYTAAGALNATIWRIRPMIIGGKPYYGACLHPYQVTDLQGTQAWEQAHREIQGLREHNDNPIFTGALGLWNGTIIYSHDKVLTGSDAGPGGDVPYADALFFGYQAGIWAEAQQAPDWIEKTFDFDDQYAVATGMIFGFDKTTFNSKDFAVIKIRTAAFSHS